MKVYYSLFAYTVVLIAGILMTICSPVLIFLMFKIDIDIWTMIFSDMFFIFILISGIGFTIMAVRRLFINRAVLELCEEGVYINYGAFNLKKLFISKEEIIKLEHITKSSNEASLPVEGIFRFTLKNDDILSGIGIFTSFDKNMRFKTLRMHLSDCKINPCIIDKLEYYCSNTYDFKFIRD